MTNFIMLYWKSILVIILFIALVIYLIKKNQIKKVNAMLFYLVTEAESHFGNGTGSLKYAAVTTWLYERLPTIIKLIFTDKQIDKMIENAVDEMKEYLKNNKNAKILIKN